VYSPTAWSCLHDSTKCRRERREKRRGSLILQEGIEDCYEGGDFARTHPLQATTTHPSTLVYSIPGTILHHSPSLCMLPLLCILLPTSDFLDHATTLHAISASTSLAFGSNKVKSRFRFNAAVTAWHIAMRPST